MTHKEYADNFEKVLTDKIVEIGIFMYQSMGLPIEDYNFKVNNDFKTMYDKLCFVNNFASKHKNIKALYYKDYLLD